MAAYLRQHIGKFSVSVQTVFFRKPSRVDSCQQVMARASVPRNYHSTGLLLPDARVFNGGGGLNGPKCGCGCSNAVGCIVIP